MYSEAISRHLAAPPKEHAAIFNLPPSRPERAILKPYPFFPIRLALGTLQSSSITRRVG
jgi:hypothetical protein